MVAVVSVASANVFIVTVLVEVIAAACVIEPAVEVRLSTGTVTVAGVAPPATFNVPPLERETGWVVEATIPLVRIVPVTDGALSESVELVVIDVAVRLPVEAVTVKADEEVMPAKLTEPEVITAVLVLASVPEVVTVPRGALMFSVTELIAAALIVPAVAVRFSVEDAVIAPSVILPAVVVIASVEPPPLMMAVVPAPTPEISPVTVTVPVFERRLVAVSRPAAEVAEIVSVEPDEIAPAVMVPPVLVMESGWVAVNAWLNVILPGVLMVIVLVEPMLAKVRSPAPVKVTVLLAAGVRVIAPVMECVPEPWRMLPAPTTVRLPAAVVALRVRSPAVSVTEILFPVAPMVSASIAPRVILPPAPAFRASVCPDVLAVMALAPCVMLPCTPLPFVSIERDPFVEATFGARVSEPLFGAETVTTGADV